MADRVDPYRNFNFLVELDGVTQAAFSECSEFGFTNAPVEYRDGTDPGTVRKLPGLTKFDDITLKWGVTSSDELSSWCEEITQGKITRKNGSIVLKDFDGTEKVRWNFFNGWPTSWKGPPLNATGTEVALETLVIAHEGIERA